MTVESLLTRELGIRFIDARALVGDAKISLGIQGYPTKNQIEDLHQEAVRIFDENSETSKQAMRQLSADLDAIKNPAGMSRRLSRSSSGSSQESSSVSSDYSSTGSNTYNSRKHFDTRALRQIMSSLHV